MKRYNGPFAAVVAERVSRATLKAKAALRGVPYPIPPGEPVGISRIADESIAYATHDYLPRRAAVGALYWVQADDEADTLPPGLVDIDGFPTPPARLGEVKPEEDFLEPLLNSPAPRPVPRG